MLAPDDPRHGTRTGYEHHQCRCDDCRDARRTYQARWRRRRRFALRADDPRHGSLNGYLNYGCRCEKCRIARRVADELTKRALP